MPTAVTHDIRITVSSRFEVAHSDPRAGRFLFSYRVHIANRSLDTVQLLRRKWTIHDSLGQVRAVEGHGVVGETPVLAPEQEYSYSSGCDLRSGMGRMEGSYLMVRHSDGQRIEVAIPPFELLLPWLAN